MGHYSCLFGRQLNLSSEHCTIAERVATHISHIAVRAFLDFTDHLPTSVSDSIPSLLSPSCQYRECETLPRGDPPLGQTSTSHCVYGVRGCRSAGLRGIVLHRGPHAAVSHRRLGITLTSASHVALNEGIVSKCRG